MCHIGTGILKTVMPDSGRKRGTPPEMVPGDGFIPTVYIR